MCVFNFLKLKYLMKKGKKHVREKEDQSGRSCSGKGPEAGRSLMPKRQAVTDERGIEADAAQEGQQRPW